MNKPLTSMARAMLLQALIAPALADTHTEADAMFKAADSADISEDYKDAAAKYRDLIVRTRGSHPTSLKIIRARARLARIYILQNQFNKAEPLFFDLIHTDRKTATLDPELMIDLDDLSDSYLKNAKDPHYIYESRKRCLALRKYINPNHPHLPEAYRQLSEYCTSCSNAKDAINWIVQAIEIEKHYSLHRQGDLIRDENYLAAIYLSRSELDKAQQTAQEGLDTLTKFGVNRPLSIQLHTTLGQVYSNKALFEQADKEYQLALKSIDSKDIDEKDTRKRITSFRQLNEQLRRKAKGGRH
jgi:tetratricopeptide (TPR) repeat protein